MTKPRMTGALVLGGLLLGVREARAAGVAIDHKGVDCIVANKYAKFDACFEPTPNLARGRVYFRAAGGAYWYFVDMKPEATCFSGVIPKVRKSTLKINYYVEAVDKSFVESRTEEFDPVVVASAEECKKKLAGFLPAANVTVGAAAGAPAIPAGFAAAGAGAGLVTAGVVAAAAATGGVVAATHKSSSNPTNPTPTSPPATAPTPQTTPPIQTTPTLAGPGTLFASFKVNPDPPAGPAPLDVTFNMCQSSDSNNAPLNFTYGFGDGSSTSGTLCRTDHVYNFAASQQVIDLRARTAKVCVSNARQTACHDFTVNASCGDTTPPSVQLVSPPDGFNSFGSPVQLTANATDADGSVAEVDFLASQTAPRRGLPPSTYFLIGTARGFPYVATFVGCGTFQLQARARDACGNTAASNTLQIFSTPLGVNCKTLLSVGATDGHVGWVTELQARGASGQVTLNGEAVSYASLGRSHGNGVIHVGDNRIEAKLAAGGERGSWGFELVGESFEPGSLRVVAGEVALVTANAIVFHIKGTPGERVVFAFKGR